MDTLHEIADNINSKESFVRFLVAQHEDYLQNGRNPDKWENNTLQNFLEAMSAWANDMEGYYKNWNLPIPENVNWKPFADILLGAVVYE